MGLTSLQVCMDSSDDWLQEEAGMDSSSPSEDILTCSRPLLEKRLSPQHKQGVKCPRCDSTHTKFCYYNNYSLSQPRYFCKACRRYWTKGGTLRNIPVGGGCKKNKKVATRASNYNIDHQSANNSRSSSNSHSPTHLHLLFPEMHLSHLENNVHTNFMLENPSPIDFMESKLGGIVGSFRNHEFMGINGGELGMIDMSHGLIAPNFNPYGMSLDGNVNTFADTFIDVKQNTKLLSLDCQDQGCSDAGKDSYGFLNNLGSWNGMMDGYGASTTNQFL